MYCRINHASGYIKEKNENKYLVFGSTDQNKELLKKYADVLDGIKNEIKPINGGKKKMIMAKITWKLSLILMKACH